MRRSYDICPSCKKQIPSWCMTCPECNGIIRKNIPIGHLPENMGDVDFNDDYTYNDYLYDLQWDWYEEAQNRKKKLKEKQAEERKKRREKNLALRSKKYETLINIISWFIFIWTFIWFVFFYRWVYISFNNVLWTWWNILLIPFTMCSFFLLSRFVFRIIWYFFENKILKKLQKRCINISIFWFVTTFVIIPLWFWLFALIWNLIS